MIEVSEASLFNLPALLGVLDFFRVRHKKNKPVLATAVDQFNRRIRFERENSPDVFFLNIHHLTL